MAKELTIVKSELTKLLKLVWIKLIFELIEVIVGETVAIYLSYIGLIPVTLSVLLKYHYVYTFDNNRIISAPHKPVYLNAILFWKFVTLDYAAITVFKFMQPGLQVLIVVQPVARGAGEHWLSLKTNRSVRKVRSVVQVGG